LALDVAGLASGVGAVRTLMVRGLVSARKFHFVFSLGEVAVSTASLFTKLSEDCQSPDNPKCQALSRYLAIIQLVTIYPSLKLNMAKSLNNSARNVETAIENIADKRKFLSLQPKHYLTYKLKAAGLTDASPLVVYSKTCGEEGRILSELSDNVLEGINNRSLANGGNNFDFDNLVQDLVQSKTASSTSQAGDLPNVSDDLVKFLNDNPQDGIDTWKYYDEAFPNGPWRCIN